MRVKGWQHNLAKYLHDLRDAEPGPMPCAMFAAGAVLAMTGKDLAKPFRHFKTDLGAVKKLKRDGFADHVEYVASLLPDADKPLPGDVVVIDGALTIYQGKGRSYAIGFDGRPGLVDATNFKRAFRV
jgi:hypothetical protein